MIDSIVKYVIGKVRLIGNTDGTLIGNVGDRLKITGTTVTALDGSKFRVVDMNAANGGVARNTSISSTTVYTNIFSYSGSGTLRAFAVTFEGNLLGADPFNIRLTIDGVECFAISTLDVGTTALYNLLAQNIEGNLGMSVRDNSMFFSTGAIPLTYSTSVAIAIKKAAGGGKRFRAGYVNMTKDT